MSKEMVSYDAAVEAADAKYFGGDDAEVEAEAVETTEEEAPETPAEEPEGEEDPFELPGDGEEGSEPEKSEQSEEEPAKFEKVLRVNGRDVTLTDESEYDRLAQMGLSAQERWEKAAEIRKATGEFLTKVGENSNPEEALRELRRIKVPIDEILELRIQELAKEYKMTPEERALEQRRREVEEQERAWKQRLEAQEKARAEAEVQQHLKALPERLGNAIQEVGIPDTKGVRYRVLQVIKSHSNPSEGYVLTERMAAQIVAEELKGLYGDVKPAEPEQPVKKPNVRKPGAKRSATPRRGEKIRLRVDGTLEEFDADLKKFGLA